MDEQLIRQYYEEHPEGLPGTPDIPELWEMHKLYEQRVAAIEPAVLLDAGCGKGYLGATLAAHCEAYHGFDISHSAVAIASERIPDGEFDVGTLRCLPYPDGYADCIVCAEVLEHVPDYAAAIRELARVAKSGSTLLISTPNKINPDMRYRTWRRGKYTNQIYDKPAHYKELIAVFKSNGLTVDEFFSFFFLPPLGESMPRAIRIPLMAFQGGLSRFIRVPLGLYLFFVLRK